MRTKAESRTEERALLPTCTQEPLQQGQPKQKARHLLQPWHVLLLCSRPLQHSEGPEEAGSVPLRSTARPTVLTGSKKR